MDGIVKIAADGIAIIKNPALRQALLAAYESPGGITAARTAEQVFRRLTASNWSVDTLCHFLAGWRSTHVTALFVSGLMVRLAREAVRFDPDAITFLYRTIGEMGEIIAEDTGVGGTPHNELFRQFANYVVGDDRWQLDRYAMPACLRFRNFCRSQRLQAPLEEAILTTAASESWNSGEYTFFNGLLRPWTIGYLGRSPEQLEAKAQYISVHAGQTERCHFLHAIKAWELFCEAVGKSPDPMKARLVFDRYLEGVGMAFQELGHLLEATSN